MRPFAVLGDPVRRRIVEVLADREHASGEIVDKVGGEFDISQSAISQQLEVLRDASFAHARAEGRRRVYTLDPAPLMMIDAWLDRYRVLWTTALDELQLEVARGKEERSARDEPSN